MHEQNKETENIKKPKQILELKKAITEPKNSLEGFNNGFDQAEVIREPKDKSFETIQLEEQQEKEMKQSKENLKDLYSNIKSPIYT